MVLILNVAKGEVLWIYQVTARTKYDHKLHTIYFHRRVITLLYKMLVTQSTSVFICMTMLPEVTYSPSYLIWVYKFLENSL